MKFYQLVLSPSSNSAIGTTEYLTVAFHLKKGTKCIEVLQPQTKRCDDRECSKHQSKLPEMLLQNFA